MGGDIADLCVTQVQGARVQMPWSGLLCFVLAPVTPLGGTLATVQQIIHVVLQ